MLGRVISAVPRGMEHDVPRLKHDPLPPLFALFRLLFTLLIEQPVRDPIDLDRKRLDPDVAKLRLSACDQLGVHILQMGKCLISGNLPSLNVERSKPRLGPDMVAIMVEAMDNSQ